MVYHIWSYIFNQTNGMLNQRSTTSRQGSRVAHLSDLRPRGLSKLLSDRSMPEAARLSPRVRAPSDCSRRATAAAKRFSPPKLVATSLYMGPVTCSTAKSSESKGTVFQARRTSSRACYLHHCAESQHAALHSQGRQWLTFACHGAAASKWCCKVTCKHVRTSDLGKY